MQRGADGRSAECNNRENCDNREIRVSRRSGAIKRMRRDSRIRLSNRDRVFSSGLEMRNVNPGLPLASFDRGFSKFAGLDLLLLAPAPGN